jgi:hypothetical protein
VPLAILVTTSLALSLAVFQLSGGREIGDDAAKLIRFARMPFVLWGDYRAAGLYDTWGSFPPLLPLVFGAPVSPWLAVTGSDFWGFRLGILSWAVVALITLHLVLKGEKGIPGARPRSALFVFAVLPSMLGAIAFIPQEEIYVSIYCLALYYFARNEKWTVVFFTLVLTFFAGKYYLLALAVPLALASPRPARNFLLWVGTTGVLLAAYVSYHKILHGLAPIVSYAVEPDWSVSVWALFWNLGGRLDLQVIRVLPLGLLAVLIPAFCIAARRRGLSLVFSMAGTLYITLLGLSATGPGYVLWNIPLVLICIASMRDVRKRVAMIVLLFLWGAGEWGANFFRGVKLALDSEREAGKTAIAALAERFLGGDFPYHASHVACIALVVAIGLCQLYILWEAGRKVRATEARPLS